MNKTLDAMRKLLESDIPDLKNEISKRKTFVRSINVLLSFLGVVLLLFIFLPNSITMELITNLEDKVDFVDSAMSILVGLFVSFVSVSLWAKQQSQNSVRKITDDIHHLVHRIDMYQLGKTRNQILENAEDSNDPRLLAYLNSIFVSIQICGKMAALVYHNSDDDTVTQSARHLEVIAHQKAELITKVWGKLINK